MTTPQDATVFALVYGTPLVHYANLANKIRDNLDGVFTTNAFYHQPKLASAGFDDINRPNVDTLYSEAVVDLSSQNLIVTIPEDFPTDRFYVFPFYDVYGNNFVNLGTAGDSSAAGNYLVSFRYANPGYVASDGSDGFVGYIYMPTPYGAIDLRIQVNGLTDVPTVRNLQSQFTLVTAAIPDPLAPELTQSLLPDDLSIKDPEGILQLTASLSQFCPPEVASDIRRIISTLRLAGLEGGSYSTPSGVDLESAIAEAIKKIASVITSEYDTYFLDLGHSFGRLRDEYSGDFKSHYLVRAFVAAEGYLQLKAQQSIYPIYKTTEVLSSNTAYKVTFSGKPPVNGFWSLTVYNEQALLIDNPLHIYSRGDRSRLKYPSGDLVYGSGSDSDGEFIILLQSQDIRPPESYISNWIPTPSQNPDGKKGTLFDITIRFYGPKDVLFLPGDSSEAYQYPVVAPLEEPVTETTSNV